MGYEIDLTELFEAYADCRKNKCNTMNALAFEMDYERELIQLGEEISSGIYQPGRSIAFVVSQLSVLTQFDGRLFTINDGLMATKNVQSPYCT